jgi:hypothetical protein
MQRQLTPNGFNGNGNGNNGSMRDHVSPHNDSSDYKYGKIKFISL